MHVTLPELVQTKPLHFPRGEMPADILLMDDNYYPLLTKWLCQFSTDTCKINSEQYPFKTLQDTPLGVTKQVFRNSAKVTFSDFINNIKIAMSFRLRRMIVCTKLCSFCHFGLHPIGCIQSANYGTRQMFWQYEQGLMQQSSPYVNAGAQCDSTSVVTW